MRNLMSIVIASVLALTVVACGGFDAAASGEAEIAEDVSLEEQFVGSWRGENDAGATVAVTYKANGELTLRTRGPARTTQVEASEEGDVLVLRIEGMSGLMAVQFHSADSVLFGYTPQDVTPAEALSTAGNAGILTRVGGGN